MSSSSGPSAVDDGAAPGRAVLRGADGVRVTLRVTPRASRARIEGLWVDAEGQVLLKVAVTAPPEDGKANAAVLKLLARAWKVPKSRLSIAAGAKDRRKVVLLAGAADALAPQIEDWLAQLPRRRI